MVLTGVALVSLCAASRAGTLVGRADEAAKKGADKIKELAGEIKESVSEEGAKLRENLKSVTTTIRDQINTLATAFKDQVAYGVQSLKSGVASVAGPRATRPTVRTAEVIPAERPPIKSELLDDHFLQEQGIVKLWSTDVSALGARKVLLQDDVLYIEDNNNDISAIRLSDGRVKWIYPLRRPSDLELVGDKSRLYVFLAGTVLAIDRDEGGSLWWKNLRHVPTSPAFVTNNLLIMGTIGGVLVGVSKDDLTVSWRFKVDGEVISRPYYQEGILHAATQKGKIVACDPVHLNTLWTYPTSDKFSAPIVSDLSKIYVAGRDYVLYSFYRERGAVVWTGLTEGAIYDPPWVDRENIYVHAEADGLYAFDVKRGKLLWRLGSGIQPLAIGQKNVYVQLEGPRVAAVERATGKIVWERDAMPFNFFIQNTRSNTMYLVSQDGQVVALQVRSDKPTLTAPTEEKPAEKVAPAKPQATKEGKPGAAPTEGEAKEGEAKPAEGEAKEGEAKPAEGEAKEGEAKPTEGEEEKGRTAEKKEAKEGEAKPAEGEEEKGKAAEKKEAKEGEDEERPKGPVGGNEPDKEEEAKEGEKEKAEEKPAEGEEEKGKAAENKEAKEGEDEERPKGPVGGDEPDKGENAKENDKGDKPGEAEKPADEEKKEDNKGE